ncbi:MAG: hypothetical protein ACPGVH_05650 [Chitinophagales bacterium]
MKLKPIIYTFAAVAILTISCKKEEIDYSPKISLVSMAPLQVTEYADSIVFTIKYEDKNGDIGIPDADINSLWLKDARLDKADEYFIAPLAPLDTEVSIEGELKINLKNTFKLGNSPSEKTKFTIWLKDRAGNESNIIETPELTIIE